jgi:hypothetical protein
MALYFSRLTVVHKLGNFGHAYCVRIVKFGQENVQQYVQFLGEICPDDDLDHEEDFLTAEECRKRRQKAVGV